MIIFDKMQINSSQIHDYLLASSSKPTLKTSITRQPINRLYYHYFCSSQAIVMSKTIKPIIAANQNTQQFRYVLIAGICCQANGVKLLGWSSFSQLPMIIPEIDPEILSQTTTLIKMVQLACGTCLHTNKIKIANAENPPMNINFPQVKSNLEQVASNSMKHLTEIMYLQRKYTIEDVYQFSLVQSNETQGRRQPGTFISDSGNSKNSGQEWNSDSSKKQVESKKLKNKKICFFHKGEKRNHRFIKRNTKNIPKNFCKAFANHMQERPNKLTDEWTLALKNLRRIQKKEKYNNITMKKILQNQAIVPFFKDFLLNYAEEWINTSKISDKKVHFEAIKIYLELLGKLSYAEVDQSPSDQ